jgi:uncharacterized protein
MLRGFDSLALVITILGGMNWGLIAALQYNLIAAIFGGSDTLATRSVYAVLGLSAFWTLRFLAMTCRPHDAYQDEKPYTVDRAPTSTRPV